MPTKPRAWVQLQVGDGGKPAPGWHRLLLPFSGPAGSAGPACLFPAHTLPGKPDLPKHSPVSLSGKRKSPLVDPGESDSTNPASNPH